MEISSASPISSPVTSRLAKWSLGLGIAGLVLTPVFIGALFTLPALICGHVARARIKRSGGALQGRGKALAGLILGYTSILVFCVMMMIVSMNNTFSEARTKACISNLRAIDTAKEQWANEKKKAVGVTPTWDDLKPYLRDQHEPYCPMDGQYTVNALGTKPACTLPGHLAP